MVSLRARVRWCLVVVSVVVAAAVVAVGKMAMKIRRSGPSCRVAVDEHMSRFSCRMSHVRSHMLNITCQICSEFNWLHRVSQMKQTFTIDRESSVRHLHLHAVLAE
jgi:hypothetical protein